MTRTTLDANEIKKAWETMKKELKKEFKNIPALHSNFTMNARQIKNRTATFKATYYDEYDNVIAYTKRTIERFMSYDTWTDAEKQDAKEDYERDIAKVESLKSTYGTRENEAKAYCDMIRSSKAFAKFTSTVGQTDMHIEIDNDGCYTIRFTY